MTTSAEAERSNDCFSSPDYKSGGKRLLRQQRERREVTATETRVGNSKVEKKQKNAVYFKMYGGAAESGLAFTESLAAAICIDGGSLQNPLRGATHID